MEAKMAAPIGDSWDLSSSMISLGLDLVETRRISWRGHILLRDSLGYFRHHIFWSLCVADIKDISQFIIRRSNTVSYCGQGHLVS